MVDGGRFPQGRGGKCLTLADGGRHVSWNRNFRTGSRTGDIRIRSVGRSDGRANSCVEMTYGCDSAASAAMWASAAVHRCSTWNAHTHTHTHTHLWIWTASIATAPSTPSVVHSAYDTIRDAIVKIFISPEWIYPVAKQTENNNFNYKYK